MPALQHRAQQPVVVELQDAQPAPRPGQPLAHEWIAIDAAGAGEVEQGAHLSLEQRLEREHRRAGPLVAERAHHDLPSAVDVAHHVVRCGAGAVEEHFAELEAAGHVADRADIDAVLVARHEQHRDAAVLRCIRVGATECVQPVGVVAERGPDLLPGDDPLVTVELGPGPQAGQVRAGVGLAEALTPHLLAARDRREEALLLLLGAELEQRRSEQVTTLHADPVRGLGGGVLDVEDQLLRRACRHGRRTPPARRR